MKVKYYPDADILVIKLSNIPYDYGQKEGDFIVHFSKKNKPVRIEILNAGAFIKKSTRSLPPTLRQQVASI